MSTISRANGVFQGEDGLVVIEIESAPTTGDSISGWVAQDEYDGFTGSGYYRYIGHQVITGPGRHILSYTVNLDEPGTYFLTLHAFRNPEGEGREAESDQENDFWVRVNGGEWEKIVFYTDRDDPESWIWGSSIGGDTRDRDEDGRLPRASYENLEAGINVIEISGRSSNVMVDRIHFATERPNRNLNEPVSQFADVPFPQSPTTSGIANFTVADRTVDTVIDLFAVFDDVEDDDADLTYTIVRNTDPDLVSAAIDPISGQLTLSYDEAAVGNADLTVQATDTDGLSVTTRFRVTLTDAQDSDGADDGAGDPGGADDADDAGEPGGADNADDTDTADGPGNADDGNDAAPPTGTDSGGNGSDTVTPLPGADGAAPDLPGDAGGAEPSGGTPPPGDGAGVPPTLISPDLSAPDLSSPDGEPVLGPSIILGTPQRDRLRGTLRADEMRGLNQRDLIVGGAGNDVIFGGRGSDRLRGGNGDDELYGEAGKDRLVGGKGDDLLDGGRGRTLAKGGSGCDTFVLNTGGKFMVIRDFEECDRLGLTDGIRFNQLDIFEQGRHTRIALGDDTLAVLRGVQAEDLNRQAFVS